MKTEYVLGFLFTPDRRSVALIEKKRPAWQAGKLNGLGGKIEDGEAAVDAMVREFEEEAGVKIPADQWQYFLTIEGGDWRVYIYRSFGHWSIHSCTDEQVAWTVINSTETGVLYPSDSIIPNLKWIIPLALDADRVCGAITYL